MSTSAPDPALPSSVLSPFELAYLSQLKPAQDAATAADRLELSDVPISLVLALLMARNTDPDLEYKHVQDLWSFLPQKLRPTTQSQHKAMEDVVRKLSPAEFYDAALNELRHELSVSDVVEEARLQKEVRGLVDSLCINHTTAEYSELGLSEVQVNRSAVEAYCKYQIRKEEFKREWNRTKYEDAQHNVAPHTVGRAAFHS